MAGSDRNSQDSHVLICNSSWKADLLGIILPAETLMSLVISAVEIMDRAGIVKLRGLLDN